jgi:hypothetical protein
MAGLNDMLFTYTAVDLTKPATDSVMKNIDNVNKKVKSTFLNPNVFQGWAMSLMFAGMAMERASKSIRQFGTKAFDDITHSMEGATTQNDLLQGSLKYLGYTIGEALDPVLGYLIPIVDKISEWVETHPQLTAWGITLLGIVGTIAMIGGMWALAIVNGLIPFITGIVTGFPIVIGWFTSLIASANALSLSMTGLGLASLLSIVGIIAGIVLAIIWIFKLKDAMGGWGEFFKAVARGILRVIMIIGEAFVWLGNLIVTAVVSAINLLIKAINALLQSGVVQWGAKKLGISIGKIPTIPKSQYEWGDAMLGKYLEWEQSGALAPNTDKGYATGGGIVPTYNTYNINVDKINTNDSSDLMNQLQRYAQQANTSG